MAFVAVLTLSCSQAGTALAEPVFSAISVDPPRDNEHPAAMYQLGIPSHGSTMFGVFYRDSGVAAHPTVILLHGLPGFEQNTDLAQSIRRAGWNVLIFHYRGAWGSGGTFSFAHCIEDLQAAIDYLRTPETTASLGVDPKRLVLIGTTLGGFLAAIGTANNPDVIGAALLSPWDPGVFAKPNELADQALLTDFRSDTGPLRGATAAGLFSEARSHAAAWSLTKDDFRWGGRPLLITETDDFLGANDTDVAAAARKTRRATVTEAHFTTDHTYSDHRIALQTTILKWLAQFVRDPKP